MQDYEHKALLFAEKYGVVDYKVVGSEIIYREHFPLENAVYEARVNLDTMEEIRKYVGVVH